MGRSEFSDLRLSSRRASTEHARIRWRARTWYIRDLGSTNGTTLNGSQLEPSRYVPLASGDELRFGADEETWRLLDSAPPEPCAVCLDSRERRWGDAELLLLPTEEQPLASIFRQGTSWFADLQGALSEVRSEAVIELESSRFRLSLPEHADLPDTATAEDEFDVQRAEVILRVSPDEECVVMALRQGSRTKVLPARACLYTLLTLARAHLNDERRDEDRGWISPERLADLLRASPEKINVDVHRVRKLLSEAGVQNAARIVERRPDSHRLRIGARYFKVEAL